MDYAELVKLTQSNNDADRKAAEAKLQEAKDANPGVFMLVAAREVYNPQQDTHVRITSAALIKRTIVYVPPGGQTAWVTIDNETRKQIKDFILASLAANEHGVRNLAANLVAEIIAIELPLGEWRELIPQLAERTSNQDINIRKAAIMALGEIAEKLKGRPDLLDLTLTESILTGICLGLQPNEANIQIREYSIKALHESLMFVRVLLEKEEVFKYVIIGVLENCIFQDRNVRVQALRCAIDLVKYYYVKVGNFVEPLWKATGEYIKSSDSELAILSIEVWNTIASIDRERRLGVGESGKSMAFGNEQTLNITAKVSQALASALVENLLKEASFEKDDGGELSVGVASFRTLCSVSEAISDLYLEYTLNFVSNNLSHDNWINRRAAVLVFNSMIEGPSKEKIVNLINNAIVALAGKIADPKIKVAEATGIALAKIAEVHPECYFSNQTAAQILPILSKGLEAAPRVSSHIAKAWSSLGEALRKIEHNLTLDSIIEALLRNAFRSDIIPSDYSLIDHSLMAVMSLIHCCNNNLTVQKFLSVFIQQLHQSVKLSGDRAKFIQSGLLACIQNALLHYEPPQNDELAEQSYLLIIELFRLIGDVTSDGIHAIAACASAMKQGFSKHMEETWKILSHSLQRTNESELFSACIGALIELSRACPDQFAQTLSELIPFLISKLNDNKFDRFLKLGIFTAMGDMALGCSKLIANYLPDILKIYDMAIEAGVKSPTELTAELNEYVEQLRDGFIESFICFMHGIEGSSKAQDLFNYLPKVIQFLQATCNKTYNPTIDYLRNALALLADVGNFYGKESRQLINPLFTQELITILRKVQGSKDQKNNEFIVNYADDVFKQLNSL